MFSRTCVFFVLALSLLWLFPAMIFPSVHIVKSLTSKLPSTERYTKGICKDTKGCQTYVQGQLLYTWYVKRRFIVYQMAWETYMNILLLKRHVFMCCANMYLHMYIYIYIHIYRYILKVFKGALADFYRVYSRYTKGISEAFFWLICFLLFCFGSSRVFVFWWLVTNGR